MSTQSDSADDALAPFSEVTRAWFRDAFPDGATPAQAEAWRAISTGEDALVVAPTGSGKTLAAFLWGLDQLTQRPQPEEPARRCRVLYVSPLKALATDVERNLRTPLAGLQGTARERGVEVSEVRTAVRTGDTPANERRTLARRPPDVLITTPESLFLVLTSQARSGLAGVETVIVDEVHALAGTKRGVHLSLSLERLDALLRRPAQRIGLSATVRPIGEVARFLSGRGADGQRGTTVVAPPHRPNLDLRIEVPVPDLSRPEEVVAPSRRDDTATKARRSVWPHVEQRVLDLVDAHTSSIVFVNARMVAERLCGRLNELATQAADTRAVPAYMMGMSGQTAGADRVVARAHHGSVSKSERAGIEAELKEGRLPAVVATSSLELGIDMGSIDLVVQVASPPSVASGLQRVGRAGHQVGVASRGVLFPTSRGDLLTTMVVSERMVAGAIEELRVPRNALDVLAQQIVAMVAMDTWRVEDVAALVRRADPYAELPETALESVLDMLAGRDTSGDFGRLRPRLVWDREQDLLRGRPGSQRVAVTSGGTIPDRGLYGVYLAGGGAGPTRVGELDEEMVHESRVGDVFVLGASSWRIEEISRDRVVVSPAPGRPGRLPFWKADAIGRPAELGRALGGLVRELDGLEEDALLRRAEDGGLSEWAARNLWDYLAAQRAATGTLPDDRTIVAERFRDEMGDWRIVVHSPLGARVHAPWALALTERMRRRYGMDAQVVHGDDGLILRLPDLGESEASLRGMADELLLAPEDVESVVTEALEGSALLASRFRECAARALLLEPRQPGKRMPLWQQRLSSGQLLAAAAARESFPILVEAVRECLADDFDVATLVGLMRDFQTRRARLVEVETPRASPFAQSLLMEYTASFLYEDDAPVAERRARALTLDTELLSELLGHVRLRELLDADVVAEADAELRRTAKGWGVRGVEETADLLRELGPLTAPEVAERGGTAEWLAELERERRAVRVGIAGERMWAFADDVPRLRAAFAADAPDTGGAPAVPPDALEVELARFARTRGPFTVMEVAGRFGLDAADVEAALRRLSGEGRTTEGEFRPGGRGVEWCDTDVLRMLRRRSIARLRREVEPVSQQALARFTTRWQHVGPSRLEGPDAVLRAVESLGGQPVPASSLETLILPSRVRGYVPAMLDELTSAGEVLWTGAGALPGSDGWVCLVPVGSAAELLPDPGHLPSSPLHGAVLGALSGGGARFFRDVVDRVTSELGSRAVTDTEVVEALWDAVWAGLVGNDTLAPLRTSLHATSRGRAVRGRPRMPTRSGPATAAGRWWAVPQREPDPTRRSHAQVAALLDRFGVLTRASTGGTPGAFVPDYRILREMEEAGQIRRGYFVSGLGAAQFALPGAVERLRANTDASAESPIVLAATDPANAYGAAVPWPQRQAPGGRPARKAGAIVVLDNGDLLLYLEPGGRSVLTNTEDPTQLERAAQALAALPAAGRIESIAVERADGAPVFDTPLAAALTAAGFHTTPKAMRVRI